MPPRWPRIVYWAGSGDVKNNFRCWANAADDVSIAGVGYSELVFDLCSELGAPLLALTSHPNPCVAGNDLIRVESVAPPFAGKAGLAYHLAQVQAATLIARKARQFDADIVVISEEISPLATLPLLALGVRLVQIRHCSLWPRHTRVPLKERLRCHLYGHAYRIGFAAVLGVSATVVDQVRDVVGGPSVPTIEFLPVWRERSRDVPPPSARVTPFRVLFAGRVVASKGVFDVLTLAQELAAQGLEIEFDLCGDGPDLANVKRLVDERRLTNVFVHGWCSPRELQRHLAGAHAVLVPTRSDFIEGFNKVVVEALLAGRPVVASDVCPAVEYVDEAVLVYRAGDLVGCRDALVRLATDHAFYAKRQEQSLRAARPFLDPRFGLGEALRGVLTSLKSGRRLESRRIRGSAEFIAAREVRSTPLGQAGGATREAPPAPHDDRAA